jgi:hypothetical protein
LLVGVPIRKRIWVRWARLGTKQGLELCKDRAKPRQSGDVFETGRCVAGQKSVHPHGLQRKVLESHAIAGAMELCPPEEGGRAVQFRP